MPLIQQPGTAMNPRVQRIDLGTLYKRDSKGVVREWSVASEGDEVIVRHGTQGGKIQEKRTTCKAKNIGRANETTPERQAILEAKSKFDKQRDRDCYTAHPDDPAPYLQPMLARDYTKVGHQVDWSEEQIAQPKLDGVRGVHITDKVDQLQSREGTFYKLPHLYQQLQVFAELIGIDPQFESLDGEVCKMGVPLGQILGACRKPNELTPELNFYVFDIIDSTGASFKERAEKIHKLDPSDSVWLDMPNIRIVDTFQGLTHSTVKTMHDKFVSEGYEGLMIRRGDSCYKVGERSSDLMKYKEFKEEEFLCVGVTEDLNGNGVLQFKCPEGVTKAETFGAKSRGDDASRRHQIEHPDEYVGGSFTIRFFDYTEFGIPQFPICICRRD